MVYEANKLLNILKWRNQERAKQDHYCVDILIINTSDLVQKIIKPSVLAMVKLVHFLNFNISSVKCQPLSLVNGKPFIPVKSIVNNRTPQRKMMK